MGNHTESDKALRYIAQLDDARCAGRWKDVPELCRKVEKHAPHRKCLTLTARSEAQIAAYSTQRPSTAASTASTASSGLTNIIPSLLTAVEEETQHPQDAFQATVCLGWLHYVLEEPGLAIARFPSDLVAAAAQTQEAALTGWSRVCIVKGTFLKGSSQEKTGSVEASFASYSSILPWLSSRSIASETPQFRMWTEHLLVRLCQLSGLSSETGAYMEPADALKTFRFWAKYWELSAKHGGTDGTSSAKYRRLAWKAYYESLSHILRYDIPHEPESSSLDPATEKSSPLLRPRLQQRAELKKVEAIYESLLLKETQFPKASETNVEIEQWVDAVMENWRVLCGPTWTNADLGEGGKGAVGRGVLDILYRAATKTYHSTQILRHLFTVHASLADFDLAFKAYDSYVEIITRGKDRAEKTGEADVGIDDDSTVLRTSAEAIKVLCRFGDMAESEKALEIGHTIEKWLEQSEHMNSSTSDAVSARSIETIVEPRSLSLAYCAIGISLAKWARFTHEADSRATIQGKAVQYLEKSLSPALEAPNNLEALYALALVLAETRDISGSIKVVKRALSSASNRGKNDARADGSATLGYTAEFARERKLIPFWHLLALLLTSRSEYPAAERACEAAFEQFGDPTILFGKEDADGYRSEHLKELNGTKDQKLGLVDQMERFEKTSILEIKMTQLSLREVVEGSAAAVDGCDELLALYARLFGDSAVEQTQAKAITTTATMAPPKSAVGTIKGSIFRSRGSIRSPLKQHRERNSSVASSAASGSVAQTVGTPAIQVTDEEPNGHPKEHHHHLLPHRHHDSSSGVQRSPSKLRKRSASSLRKRADSEGEQAHEVPQLPETTPARSSTVRSRSVRGSSVSSVNRKSLESHEQPLRPIPHNLPPGSEPPPSGHARQPPRQDVRLPAPFPNANHIPPEPQFSKIQERRQKITLLTSIWLFICGLYTRAGMHEDAKDAVLEAHKLVEDFEAAVARESSTSRAFAEKSWGGGKSVEELWGDVHAVRGELFVAQGLPHDARADFERAVLHLPNHPQAIVGLSNILLDVYCKVIPLQRSTGVGVTTFSSPPSVPSLSDAAETRTAHLTAHIPSAENQISPPELSRLAARDRAFGLLSTLTKLGVGWDYTEAWYALARAYEESGQIEKTKEVLWWCVELEDTHPVRSWKAVTLGGFVL